MSELLAMVVPELVLIVAACVLFFAGGAGKSRGTAAAPWLAMAAILAAMVLNAYAFLPPQNVMDGVSGSLRLDSFAGFIRLVTCVVGVILLLLAWPTRPDGSGNLAVVWGQNAGEFFAMFLLSIAGLLLVTLANDLIVLFLAIEMVSIPTYVMVSLSRPAAAAQEAALKYFFLGAMSSAVMLFGMSYLYGTTGEIAFGPLSANLRAAIQTAGSLSTWQMMAVLMVLVGLAFKMAAFPMHFYVGDVYEGAAAPVTAFIAFVPKAAGFVALLRLLWIVGGNEFELPAQIVTLLWVMAAVTMSIGNTLAILQNNVKRLMAYSSVAHSGYMLVGVAALHVPRTQAMEGVIFYLAAYGIMNAGAFGVLTLLPARDGRDDGAETFADLAGQGRRHVAIGLAMTVCCLSLIGIPLTVGFLGKLLLIRQGLGAGLNWLVVVLLVNAVLSAAYYLRIVGVMFLAAESGGPIPAELADRQRLGGQSAVVLGVVLAVVATVGFGAVAPVAQVLMSGASLGSTMWVGGARE